MKKTTNRELILDAGFFIALLNKKDHHHKTARKLIQSLPNRQWVTTWLVLTEVTHMLMKANATNGVVGLLDLCENGGITLFQLELTHIARLKQLMQKYKTLPADLADTSLIVLAEALGHGDILSTDQRDFSTYRWKNHQPFNNLFKV